MFSHSNQSLAQFSFQNHLQGLTLHSLQAVESGCKNYSLDKAKQFLKFQQRINKELLMHPVIRDNSYTEWFEQGQHNQAQIKAFIIQFSVFSNQFMIAQLNKMIHADSLESMRASKEILANEMGVKFKSIEGERENSTEGSIEGSHFYFSAGHFEWIYSIAKKLGMRFSDIGQPRHGNKSTLFFCNELIRLYGGENYQISQAASYAVENWAAAGFWKQLIKGFTCYNQQHSINLPLGFFIWHDQLESQHAAHTQEELEELYFSHSLDEDAFIQYGNEMLDAVAVFWNGLDQQRKEMDTIH